MWGNKNDVSQKPSILDQWKLKKENLFVDCPPLVNFPKKAHFIIFVVIFLSVWWMDGLWKDYSELFSDKNTPVFEKGNSKIADFLDFPKKILPAWIFSYKQKNIFAWPTNQTTFWWLEWRKPRNFLGGTSIFKVATLNGKRTLLSEHTHPPT